jgi:multimeric flavodoxin WrbA
MSPKRVLIVNGSPRRRGNSALLAEQVAVGAREAGADVETVTIQGMDVQPCTACEACKGTEEGDCIIQDDMQSLYPKIRSADVIVIATPIYWFTMSAQAKLFIDRFYALIDTARGNLLTGKRFAFVLAYGDSDPFTSGAINAIRAFQDMCRYLEAEIVGFVYGTASDEGEIQSQKDLLEEARRLGQKLA